MRHAKDSRTISTAIAGTKLPCLPELAAFATTTAVPGVKLPCAAALALSGGRFGMGASNAALTLFTSTLSILKAALLGQRG